MAPRDCAVAITTPTSRRCVAAALALIPVVLLVAYDASLPPCPRGIPHGLMVQERPTSLPTPAFANKSTTIYVYRIPSRLAGPECPYCGVGAGHTHPGYMTEVMAHEALRTSPFATDDPLAARWFVVPLRYSCAMVCRLRFGDVQVGQLVGGRCEAERQAVAYVQRVFSWLRTQPQWLDQPHRHVFVWAHDKGAYRIAEHAPSLFNELRRGLFVQLAGSIMPGRPLAFDPFWDVVLPPATRRTVRDVPASAAEARARAHVAFWQGGSLPGQHELATKYAIRARWVRAYASNPSLRHRADISVRRHSRVVPGLEPVPSGPRTKLVTLLSDSQVRSGQQGSPRDVRATRLGMANATFCLFLPAQPQRCAAPTEPFSVLTGASCALTNSDRAQRASIRSDKLRSTQKPPFWAFDEPYWALDDPR